MTTLTFNIPDEKTKLVKELLTELGATLQEEIVQDKRKALQKALLNLPAWSEEDIKAIEEAREAFNGVRPAQW